MSIQSMEQGRSGWQPSREEVSEFLRGLPHCRIGTVEKGGEPRISFVAFSVTADGNFIVGTNQDSTKAQNIRRDPRVAIEATDPDRRYTVQAQATARILTPDEFGPYAEEHYDQLPSSRPFRDQPGEVNILITPHRLRFSDCNPFPWVLTEFDR